MITIIRRFYTKMQRRSLLKLRIAKNPFIYILLTYATG
jgi:hypothetical protein